MRLGARHQAIALSRCCFAWAGSFARKMSRMCSLATQHSRISSVGSAASRAASILSHAAAGAVECAVRETHDSERVGCDLCVWAEVLVGAGACDAAAVALVGVTAHDLDACEPFCGLLFEPSAQPGGVAAVEDVDDLPGGGVDRGAHAAAARQPRRGTHHGLVEAQPRYRRDPAGIARGPLRCRSDRGPHRGPRDPQPTRHRRHGALHRLQAAGGPLLSAACQHPPRPRQLALLGPRAGLAPRVRAPPHALVPPHLARNTAWIRRVAQPHLPAALRTRPHTATPTTHPPPVRGLHPHHDLAALDANPRDLHATRAPHTTEPTSPTRGLPTLGLFDKSQESARPPPQRRTLTSPRSQLR